MNRDIARLRPAEVLEARYLPPRDPALETWTDSRYALKARLDRALRRGEVAAAGPWRPVAGLDGWYSVEVRRLKRPVPAWRPWVLWGSAALMVPVGLFVAAWLLMPVWLGYLLMVGGASLAAGGVALKVRSRRGGVTVIQTVNIRR